jgi:hypothetical protein
MKGRLWFVLVIANCCSALFGIEFYVSPSGNDGNPGTFEKPFATLEKARDAIREIKSRQSFIPEGAAVYLRQGVYSLSDGFELNGLDGGLSGSPIVYSGYEDETVCLSGGKPLSPTSIKKVTDQKILDRIIDANARKNLYYVDLRKEGITDYGQVYPRPDLKCELFFNKRFLPLARYPNDGWLKITDVPQNGPKLENPGRPDWVIDGIPRGKHYGRFICADNRCSSWSDQNDIYAMGYWVYDWADEIIKIEKINTATHEVYPARPYHRYGFQKDARYYFLNVLEEIDTPGEWYIDRNKGILYLWPPSAVGKGQLVFPTLSVAMIRMNDVSNVIIKNLKFESSRSGGITITGGSGNLISNCSFSNLGNTAVKILGGVNNGICDCNISELSGGGVEITGGDRKTLTPCNNFARNNEVHHFSRIYRTYNAGIKIAGVGITLSHNYIHDCPHEGIDFQGNDFLIEYNELTRVCQETEDVGAMYGMMDWTYCGTVIRYNYFHQIHGQSKYCDTKGVYLDLPVGGLVLYGNIFNDLDTGFFTNSGRNNLIQNNIFIKCNPSIHLNVYRADEQFKPGGDWKLVEKLREMNCQAPPYSLRYPWLKKVLEKGDDPAIPYGNVIKNNISYGGKFLNLHAELNFSLAKVLDNAVADPVMCTWRNMFQEQSTGEVIYKYGDPNMTAKLNSFGNLLVDPNGAAVLISGNYSLPQDHPALKQGFRQIPFDRIGLQKK